MDLSHEGAARWDLIPPKGTFTDVCFSQGTVFVLLYLFNPQFQGRFSHS